MALALPLTRMVVFVQREIRIDWLIEADSSRDSDGLSKFSTIHLLPSRSLRAGFLLRMLSGFGFFPGSGDLPRLDDWEEERDGADGTADVVRREGFLCVWDDGSTFRRCDVTDSP